MRSPGAIWRALGAKRTSLQRPNTIAWQKRVGIRLWATLGYGSQNTTQSKPGEVYGVWLVAGYLPVGGQWVVHFVGFAVLLVGRGRELQPLLYNRLPAAAAKPPSASGVSHPPRKPSCLEQFNATHSLTHWSTQRSTTARYRYGVT